MCRLYWVLICLHQLSSSVIWDHSLRNSSLKAGNKTTCLNQARLLLNVVHGPASSSSPENLLEMKNLRSHPRNTESETAFFTGPQGNFMYLRSGLLVVSRTASTTTKADLFITKLRRTFSLRVHMLGQNYPNL